MVEQHSCPRCGLETKIARGSWARQHPVLATIAGLATMVFMVPMFVAYPASASAMIALAILAYCAFFSVRERERRRALIARAEYDHAELMKNLAQRPRRAHPSSMGQVGAEQWPTTPVASPWR